MSEGLQSFRHDHSEYERPLASWECGWRREGRRCWLGPDRAGRCMGHPRHASATGPCVPSQCHPVRGGGGWTCSRSPARGGPCADGPLPDGACGRQLPPCQPTPTRRRRRRSVSFLVIGVTIGILCLAMGGQEDRLAFVLPGPLSSVHGGIAHDCSACHQLAGGSLTEWVTQIATGRGGGIDAHKCQACHDQGPHALHAHGLAPAELEALTRAAEAMTGRPWLAGLGNALAGGAYQPGQELACAGCHQEHQGAHHRLTEMADIRCQVCHRTAFDTFSAGHPPLGNYPHPRRTRIIFNHQRHFDTHFPGRPDAPPACTSCHQLEPTGRTMNTLPYEATCASCHDEDLVRPLPFFAFPGAPLEALPHVGVWPADLEVEGYEGYGTGLMAFILGEDTPDDLLDMAPDDDPEELQAAADYLLRVKALYRALLKASEPETGMGTLLWQALLQERVGHPLDEATYAELRQNLPATELRILARELLPGLTEEPRQAATRFVPESHRRAEELSERFAGRWKLDPAELLLSYQPQGHADPLMVAWLGLIPPLQAGGRLDAGATNPYLQAMQSCLKCHSVDDGDGRLQVHWRAQGSPGTASLYRATRFAHLPHVEGQGGLSCETCHAPRGLSEAAGANPYFDRLDGRFLLKLSPHQPSASFFPVHIETCQRCHHEEGADSGCLQCHSYHLHGR